MTASSDYLAQAHLLMDVLPNVAEESAFALKGGTAINMFYQNMPRLSVDIDLLWLPVADRSSSLKEIDSALDRIAALIMDRHSGITAKRASVGRISNPRIFVIQGETLIKIETSTVVRGTVLPPRTIMTSKTATKQFKSIEMNVASFEDVYAGKISAALDRQHPRDLFDVMVLYEDKGLTDDLFRVFMVYVACSRRPIHELLAPTKPLQNDWYDDRFVGMTQKKIPLETLIETGRYLQTDIASRLTGAVATFLLSLHDTEPDFGLIGLPEAAELPAVRWKLLNLEKLKRKNPKKHAEQRNALEQLFR